MKKFFSIALFVLFAFSLVAMTGCDNNSTTNVIDHVSTGNYAYTITKTHYNFWRRDEYTLEFWGGTLEQRQNIATTPFYRKSVDKWESNVVFLASANINEWQQLQNRQ